MNNHYGKLKRKIFLWVILCAGLAYILGFLLLKLFIDGIFQAPFADSFISICTHVLRMDDTSALSFYSWLFRQHKNFWLFFGYIIVLLFIFYLAFSRFTRYFNEVANGIDQLAEEEDQTITLSSEMEYIEKKLNLIRQKLKKRQQDAQEAEQRKNDLVLYLAHDIKTPLTSVIGYLSLLDEAPDMPAEQKAKYIKITLDKSFRLEQLINEFFEITRFNLQTIPLEKADINLSYLLMQLADEFYPLLAQGNKTITIDAPEKLTLNGDADKLVRVFNNILKNALFYSDENTNIAITAKPTEDNILITFQNYGKTIPAQKLNSIFDKFFRTDDARSTNTGGAGLGLAIAKSIVTAHGGTITAQSVNNQTTFTIMLPA